MITVQLFIGEKQSAVVWILLLQSISSLKLWSLEDEKGGILPTSSLTAGQGKESHSNSSVLTIAVENI